MELLEQHQQALGQLEEFKKKNLESFTKESTKRKASEFLILNNN